VANFPTTHELSQKAWGPFLEVEKSQIQTYLISQSHWSHKENTGVEPSVPGFSTNQTFGGELVSPAPPVAGVATTVLNLISMLPDQIGR